MSPRAWTGLTVLVQVSAGLPVALHERDRDPLRLVVWVTVRDTVRASVTLAEEEVEGLGVQVALPDGAWGKPGGRGCCKPMQLFRVVQPCGGFLSGRKGTRKAVEAQETNGCMVVNVCMCVCAMCGHVLHVLETTTRLLCWPWRAVADSPNQALMLPLRNGRASQWGGGRAARWGATQGGGP